MIVGLNFERMSKAIYWRKIKNIKITSKTNLRYLCCNYPVIL